MVRFRSLIPLLLTALALAACKDSPRAAASAPVAPAEPVASTASVPNGALSPDAYRVAVMSTEHPGRPSLQFTLLAEAAPGADGILRVKLIEVRRSGSNALLQSLDGLATQTPSTVDSPGLEQIDLDFDGVPDIRVVESLPAGPNVPYRNWRYDLTSGRFVAVPELDEITSPVFDAERREIRSDWRDSAARYGTDTFAWREGRLEPQSRVSSEALATGKITQRRYNWAAGSWILEGRR